MWDGINHVFYLIAIIAAFASAIKQILLGIHLLKDYKFPNPPILDSNNEPIGHRIPASYISLIAMGDIILIALILKLS